MRKKFKYDYRHKVTIFSFIVTLLFLVLSIVSYKKTFACILCIISTVLSLVNTIFFINPQGLHINKRFNQLVIVDNYFYRRFDLNSIQYLSYKQLKKEVRSGLYGFFMEYYHPSTYMTQCEYVYNNGKVFVIEIILKKGVTYQSYFGWMYKEKNKNKVLKKEEELKAFIDSINFYLRQKNK